VRHTGSTNLQIQNFIIFGVDALTIEREGFEDLDVAVALADGREAFGDGAAEAIKFVVGRLLSPCFVDAK